MRVVLDTNVAVSALLWRGTPYRLFQAVRHHEHTQLYASAALLRELGEVLARPAIAHRLAFLGCKPHEVLADYVGAVELVTPVVTPAVVAADADDDHVIAAAVAAEADLLISGDRHLLALGSHGGIRIVSPADAIGLIGET